MKQQFKFQRNTPVNLYLTTDVSPLQDYRYST